MNKVVKGSTKFGQRLIERGSHYEGYFLEQVYENPSEEKHRAYNWCFNKYCESRNSSAFSIVSHNTFSFSVSWLFDYVDEETGEIQPAMQIETRDNSYTVLLNK